MAALIAPAEYKLASSASWAAIAVDIPPEPGVVRCAAVLIQAGLGLPELGIQGAAYPVDLHVQDFHAGREFIQSRVSPRISQMPWSFSRHQQAAVSVRRSCPALTAAGGSAIRP